MAALRTESRPVANAMRAGAVLALACCAAFLMSPFQIGMLALAAGSAALVIPQCRMAAVEWVAGLAFMAFMFGLAGVGGFVLMQALTQAPMALAVRGGRPVMALTLAVALAAAAAVCLAVFLIGLAPTRWAAFAPMAPAFALAAPGLVLRAMATASLGPVRAEALRLYALGPLLVVLVIGAGVDGLRGAAIGWAAGQVAIPCAMMLWSGRRPALLLFALGALAAGFISTLAAGAALAFADGAPLATGPALVIGGAVFVLAMRVHARIGRGLRRRNVTLSSASWMARRA